MRSLLACLILIHLSFAFAQAKKKPTELPVSAGKKLTREIEKSNAAVRQLGSRIAKDCDERREVKAQGEAQTDKILEEMNMRGAPELTYEAKTDAPKIIGPTTGLRGMMDQDLEVSVLSEEKARELHARVVRDLVPRLKYEWLSTGCVSRAHLIGIEMQGWGIAAGKVWTEPGLFVGRLDPRLHNKTERGTVNWKLHAAPFVMVEKNGKVEPWVIDPAVSMEGPLPLEKYKAKMSPHPNWINVSFSNRFSYDLQERWVDKKRYNESDAARALADIQCVERDIKTGTRGCKVIDGR